MSLINTTAYPERIITIRLAAWEVLPAVQNYIETHGLRQQARSEGWLETFTSQERQQIIEGVDIGWSPDESCYAMVARTEEYGLVSMIAVTKYLLSDRMLEAVFAHEWTHILLYPTREALHAPPSIEEQYERVAWVVAEKLTGISRQEVGCYIKAVQQLYEDPYRRNNGKE